MKIKRIIRRHHTGCFDIEDESGELFMVQLAHKLEEAWQEALKEKGEKTQKAQN
tara:strand:- start:1506 stop:1667 length:162 start_codon:yes stop_codon:yes gene_type:complete